MCMIVICLSFKRIMRFICFASLAFCMAVDICITILKCVAYCSLKLYLLNIICLLPLKNVIADVCLRIFSVLFRALTLYGKNINIIIIIIIIKIK